MRSRIYFGLFTAFFLACAAHVAAHPLGNFSISQYSALQIGEQDIELRYIVDMAEIPTFQEIQETGVGAEGRRRERESIRRAQSWKVCARLNA